MRGTLASHPFPYVLRFHNSMYRTKGEKKKKKVANLDPGEGVSGQMGEVISNLTKEGDTDIAFQFHQTSIS